MSKVFYDKPIIDQIFEEFRKKKDDHDIEKITNLVERLPPEDVNIQDDNGYNILMYTSRVGYTKIVKLLLDKRNIDINMQNIIGYTALIFASCYGYTKIVKLLLEIEGIDIDIQSEYGNTAITYALFSNYNEIAKLLEGHKFN